MDEIDSQKAYLGSDQPRECVCGVIFAWTTSRGPGACAVQSRRAILFENRAAESWLVRVADWMEGGDGSRLLADLKGLTLDGGGEAEMGGGWVSDSAGKGRRLPQRVICFVV